MKIKTSDLTGVPLGVAVLMAEGTLNQKIKMLSGVATRRYSYAKGIYSKHSSLASATHIFDTENGSYFCPSDKWEQGGPIIEREKIDVVCQEHHLENPWWAARHEFNGSGPTPLIAAMRCYVALKLGDEIEIPEEMT